MDPGKFALFDAIHQKVFGGLFLASRYLYYILRTYTIQQAGVRYRSALFMDVSVFCVCLNVCAVYQSVNKYTKPKYIYI